MSAPDLDSPVILLGAARSGTKMVRDVLGSHPSLATVPYDINYVWKYGNYSVAHDELTPGQLDPKIARYIRSYLARHLRRGKGRTLVEKTVSNCLRIEFVHAVVPDCRFVHLLRDGRDVAASARRLWRAPADWRRLLRKARRFPVRAIPTYGARYLRSYLSGGVASRGGTESWGPRFRGIDEAVRERPLLEVCGMQWQACVEASLDSLDAVAGTKVHTVRYEELVRAPQAEFARLFRFLGLEVTAEVRDHIARTVTSRHVGKGSRELSGSEEAALSRQLAPTLRRAGYPFPEGASQETS